MSHFLTFKTLVDHLLSKILYVFVAEKENITLGLLQYVIFSLKKKLKIDTKENDASRIKELPHIILR